MSIIHQSFKLSVWVALLVPLTTQSVWALSTEERLQRLEIMANNPVLLQLNQRVAEQQREIQALQNQMDRVSRAHRLAVEQATKRYSETDQRISQLENTTSKSTEQSAALSVPLANTPSLATPVLAELPEASAVTIADKNLISAPTQTAQPKDKQTQSTEGNRLANKTIVTRPATAQENDEYQKAFALMRASKYEASIQSFETFLTNSPESSLASNASYWAGEGYLIRKEYENALLAFKTVLERYPESSKVPDALLRGADTLMSLNKNDEARQLYQKIIDSHPETRAAKSARKRLSAN